MEVHGAAGGGISSHIRQQASGPPGCKRVQPQGAANTPAMLTTFHASGLTRTALHCVLLELDAVLTNMEHGTLTNIIAQQHVLFGAGTAVCD